MAKKKRFNAKGYSEAGASYSRRALKGFDAQSSSPVDDIDNNNFTLRQRARMLYMSSPAATSAINTNRTKVVGTGLTLKAAPDREILGISPEAALEWQGKVESAFKSWASKKQNCDALGVNNFEGLQQLALKSWLMSGDVFALIQRERITSTCPYSLRIHLIEADRICTPYTYANKDIPVWAAEGVIPEGKEGAGHHVHDGVEVDDVGKVIAYHICSEYPTQGYKFETPTWQRVLAYGSRTNMPNILHVMDTERPEQYRGVPYLAQVIEPLLQLRRYTESELMAALVQSFFTAWIETATNPGAIPFNEVGNGSDIEGVGGDMESDISKSDNEYEMGPGTVLHLAEGETVHFGNPNIPTAGYETFVKTITKQIGSALEIPYDVLTKEFNSSYSASRGALLEAWEAFKMRRKWFVDDFCQPIYELWLTEAVARGIIKAPGFFDDPVVRAAWCNAKWIGPVQGQLDPLKEANAAVVLMQHGIKTHEQVTRELSGGDWWENAEEIIAENSVLPCYGNMDEPDGFEGSSDKEESEGEDETD